MLPDRPQKKTKKGGACKGKRLSEISKTQRAHDRNKIPEEKRGIPSSKNAETEGKHRYDRVKILSVELLTSFSEPVKLTLIFSISEDIVFYNECLSCQIN